MSWLSPNSAVSTSTATTTAVSSVRTWSRPTWRRTCDPRSSHTTSGAPRSFGPVSASRSTWESVFAATRSETWNFVRLEFATGDMGDAPIGVRQGGANLPRNLRGANGLASPLRRVVLPHPPARAPRRTALDITPATRPRDLRLDRNLVQPETAPLLHRNAQPHRLRDHQRGMITTTNPSTETGEAQTRRVCRSMKKSPNDAASANLVGGRGS